MSQQVHIQDISPMSSGILMYKTLGNKLNLFLEQIKSQYHLNFIKQSMTQIYKKKLEIILAVQSEKNQQFELNKAFNALCLVIMLI